MKGYIHIDGDVFSEMGLSPTEAVIYSLISNYCRDGMTFDRRLCDIAESINMSDRGFRKALGRLVEAGYLKKNRAPMRVVFSAAVTTENQGEISYKKCTKSGSERTEQSSALEEELCSEQSSERTEQSSEKSRHKVPNTPYIITINTNPLIKGRVGDEKKTTSKNEEKKVQKLEEAPGYWFYVIEGLACFYEDVIGRTYVPNWSTQTTSAKDVHMKVMHVASANGWPTTPDGLASWWDQFLRIGYDAADQFLRNRWDLDTINRQFNQIINMINNNSKSTQNERRQQPRGGDVSEEYIARKLTELGSAEG